MVVSTNTTIEILRVVLKYVDKQTFKKIVADLQQVEGNQSFKDSVQKLAEMLLRD